MSNVDVIYIKNILKRDDKCLKGSNDYRTFGLKDFIASLISMNIRRASKNKQNILVNGHNVSCTLCPSYNYRIKFYPLLFTANKTKQEAVLAGNSVYLLNGTVVSKNRLTYHIGYCHVGKGRVLINFFKIIRSQLLYGQKDQDTGLYAINHCALQV